MNEIKVSPDNQFESILISAVRYCLGRRTYMPEMVTSWIMSHCAGKLSGLTVDVMVRDIETTDDLGDGCDVATWLMFKQWLKEEGAETNE